MWTTSTELWPRCPPPPHRNSVWFNFLLAAVPQTQVSRPDRGPRLDRRFSHFHTADTRSPLVLKLERRQPTRQRRSYTHRRSAEQGAIGHESRQIWHPNAAVFCLRSDRRNAADRDRRRSDGGDLPASNASKERKWFTCQSLRFMTSISAAAVSESDRRRESCVNIGLWGSDVHSRSKESRPFLHV